MDEFIAKLIERLEEEGEKHLELSKAHELGIYEQNRQKGIASVYGHAISIANQLAEEYNDGWISIDERFPENDDYILLSFANFSLPQIGRYEEDSEGGAFYLGDELETCVSQNLIVNAWQPLPGSYHPKGE